MAAEAVLSSVLSVVFDRMSSPEVVNWIKGKKLTQNLIERLKTNLYAVQAFLIDAEQKQIKERAVKNWLDSLKNAMYLADDLLDEVFTKAATQKDPGTFFSGFSSVLNLQDRDVAKRMEEIAFNMGNAPCILLSKLKYLRALSFNWFPLESLPDSIGELIHLRYLDLSWTYIMTLPDTLCNLYNLQTLKLVGCRKLKALPVSMKDLTNLRYLDISGTGLHKMPEGMSKLTSLQVLTKYVVGKHEGNKINELGALANLHQTIFIDKLENVVNSSEALEARMFEKDGIECLLLEWSPDEYENTSMSCWEEWRSVEFNAFPRLRKLFIWDCPVLSRDLPNQLPSMKDLTIGKCEQLSCCVPRAPAITCLCIEGSNEVRIGELPPLLHKLSIKGNHQAESVMEAIAHTQLTCLRFLSVSGCSSRVLFPVSSIPAALQDLTISNCKKLEFEMEGQHHSLHKLMIQNSCDSVTSFSLDSFPNLVRVEISKCEKMESLVVSRSLSSLRYLEIKNCGSLKSLQTLWVASPQLEYLSLLGCPDIDLCATGDPHRSLRDHSIIYCEKQLSCVASQFHGLTHLSIGGECESVKCLPKEGWLPATLEYLRLDSIESVEMLECKGLAHLNSLQELSIYGCYNLENINGEKLPASLLRLVIFGSPLAFPWKPTRDNFCSYGFAFNASITFNHCDREEKWLRNLVIKVNATEQPGTIIDTIRSSLQGSTRRIPEVHLHCHHNIDHFRIDYCPVTKNKY
ncbi:hypothetical protein Ahy_A10g047182 [Arachis hypogaea]|uniref:Uncharacterized protein n=1 Tax=Arachis hypogaea TaxID=3818 RepID=A0A445B1X7_ARAHY|nr:hypothetical protein Ahy_A10g047182 [Arachis hypogaea]